MVFACQNQPFLRELRTKVISCEKAKLDDKEGYEVILKDTILFPEGGGQPDDRGSINGIEVHRITRRQDLAVHFVLEPLSIGEEVHLTIDWTRRFDHMQQHSGQHLISALFEKEFGHETLSW
ncbi:alanyl-tRNA editing protein Aarsd1-like [Exaiptasia diaphana]|uniref:Uncharacterized protein n=1 Tax=Exaiptasia diaphana TaxID=2652724 RepID=A0A913XJR7_EXADI|nr:alanyl-tRNA editing protein Aarsd1-like [Exaiptasia diaphana]